MEICKEKITPKRNCKSFLGRSLFIESLRVLLNCELRSSPILTRSPRKKTQSYKSYFFRLEKMFQSVLLWSLLNYALYLVPSLHNDASSILALLLLSLVVWSKTLKERKKENI